MNVEKIERPKIGGADGFADEWFIRTVSRRSLADSTR